MEQDTPNIEDILAEAVEIAPVRRPAFIEKACGGNAEMRAKVERLIANHDRAGSFLEHPAVVLDAVAIPVNPAALGARIGPYKLLEIIGEGGMGVVYLAEQREPVRRQVALKVIKPGMDSKQVVARFEAERQALAMMDHPNIAKVLDAGTIDTGHPYFVMELVRGIPITDYCDQARLTIRQRLEVFVQVCRAVQHAHTKGVIHRDLKPPNVLVTSDDGVPVPKIIDFGVAKALEQQLTERSLHTGFAQMIGTPLYMSPEQAEFNLRGVDTRSDIYSLGVLLYELLTGVTPFDKERLRSVDFDELRRILHEEQPPRPSARISTLEAARSTVSERRGVDARVLAQMLSSELDWIVLKALEKDRTRRYESASDFAQDIKRYLLDEPVQACPPSVGYQLRKLVRRNKTALATTVLLVLILFAALGAVTGAIGWGVRNRSALEQEVAHDREIRQAELTKDMNRLFDETEKRRQEIHAKLADPIKVCELLSKIDGWHESQAKARASWQNAKDLAASNDDVLPAELADRLRTVDVQLQADETDWKTAKELDDICMQSTIVVDGRSDPTAAGPRYAHFFRELGFDWQTGQAAQIAFKIQQGRLRYVLVGALDDWASTSNATKETRAMLLETARLVDPDPWRDQVRDVRNWNNLRALERLAQEADPGIQSPRILALLAGRLGQQKGDGIALLRTAQMNYPQDFSLNFKLGFAVQNPDIKIGCYQAALALRPNDGPTHINLGVALGDKKDVNGAIQHYRKVLDVDPRYSNLAHVNLGAGLYRKSDFDGAIQHFRKAVDLDPYYALAHDSLGSALREKNDLDGATRHFRKALELDPKFTGSLCGLGNVQIDKKDYLGAISLYRKALGIDPNCAEAYHGMGKVSLVIKDLQGAVQHIRKALDLDPNLSAAHINLGNALYQKRDLDGAIRHLRKGLDLNPNNVSAHDNLGCALSEKNDFDEAIKHHRKALDLDPNRAETHNNLGAALKEKDDIDGAIQHYRKALDLDANNAAFHTNLGGALSTKKDFDGAIQHFRNALDLDPKFTSAHNRLRNALRMKKAFASAFESWNQFFLNNPRVADNPIAGYRFRAAEDAVAASGSDARDAATLTEIDRKGMRKKAYEWLHADLDSWSKHFQKKQPYAVVALASALREWQSSADLAGVRDKKHVAKIPEEERRVWQALWTDVELLREKAESMFTGTTDFSGIVSLTDREPVHEVKLRAGTTYIIDLESKAFDTFLRLESAQGKKLAENDDIVPGINMNSRLIFTPPTGATYRIVTSAFGENRTGPYTLTIREFIK